MKIVLGAVQFGLDYGISNTYGKIVKHDAKQILKFAYDNNIGMIDTASLYGESEAIIGKSTNNKHNWKIITKTPHFIDDCIDKLQVKQLRESFNQSLLNLNKKYLYGLLLHSCDDLFKPNGDLLFKEMERLKSIGLINKIGVSVYNKYQIDRVLDNFEIDLIQLPVNILDQSLISDGSLVKLKKHGVEVHARSVFLQGLLLMEENLIPSYFLPIKKNLDAFKNLARELSLTKLELALGYVASIDEIDKIVVGVNTLSQLQEIIKATQLKTNFEEYRNISINNSNYTNPSLWRI